MVGGMGWIEEVPPVAFGVEGFLGSLGVFEPEEGIVSPFSSLLYRFA